VRVPVEDGSPTGLTVVLDRAVSAEETNAADREAAEGPPEDVPRVSDAPIVSRDVVGDPASCVLDAPLTRTHGDLVKVFGRYDNEGGRTDSLYRHLPGRPGPTGDRSGCDTGRSPAGQGPMVPSFRVSRGSGWTGRNTAVPGEGQAG
jgi:hypothetical protein